MNIRKLIKEKYSSLSKGQKKVADLLLRDVVSFSMSTASQIAKKAEVSETTVIRLSYSLDFESFSQMQKYIQREFLNKKEELSNESNNKNFIDELIDTDIEILKTLKKNLDMDTYWKALEVIMSADEVKIVGFRASYSPAHWLYLKLNMLRRNVSMFTAESNFPDNLLIDQDKKNLFIFISFPSYVAQSLEIARIAKSQGAKLIAITDHLLSPISRISDISFTTQLNTYSGNFISVSSIMSLLNIITTGIERKYEKEVIDRVLKLQNIYKENEIFLE